MRRTSLSPLRAFGLDRSLIVMSTLVTKCRLKIRSQVPRAHRGKFFFCFIVTNKNPQTYQKYTIVVIAGRGSGSHMRHSCIYDHLRSLGVLSACDLLAVEHDLEGACCVSFFVFCCCCCFFLLFLFLFFLFFRHCHLHRGQTSGLLTHYARHFSPSRFINSPKR